MDGRLVEQHGGSGERHGKEGIKNPAQWPGSRN